MARQSVAPVGSFTNNIVNLFKIKTPSLDYSNTLPSDVEVDLGKKNGMNYQEGSYNIKTENDISNLTKFIAM
jgi:hypothetical protein